ncbi:hypothetical protein BCR33DRAFT_788155 [Rhizoclosmatium globosum]|uniref:Uncharacterized protein n=1 Tax=Rhizoclosmatium globosum TaxID=329046 RepID=A0A1Y2BXL7_9FUNG|nr:hypothetical protein BCR33DRAFT_788155 [Rhizoclosmatium globosum]|eukprot:ORY39512.1 hypothetical protein BCR33DRAFT_788155 [Rhizoclosmatium globosum]
MSTNEIVITPGPILPNLEARPITSYLKNRIKDPIALNMEAHASIRQFNADNNISCYSQPLPITRYIPNSQKKPNKHVAKLRDLRAQHEFKIQEDEQVVGDRVERGLMFGGEVQGLNPSFSAIRPGHEVFGRLGRVHLVSEYRTGTDGGDEGILQDGTDY